MSQTCSSCGKEVPPSPAELKVEQMMVEMGRKLLNVQALLTYRTEQLVASRQAERALRQRLQPTETAPMSRAHNRRGTPGHKRWLKKFRFRKSMTQRVLASF